MKRLSFRKLTAIALATLSISSAYAAVHESGAYLDLNAGVTYETIYLWGYHYDAFGNVGLNTNLGYQFNRYFAAEAGYTAYEEDGVLNNIDLAIKGILPISEGEHPVSLFGKIGPAYLFKGGDSTGALLVGIGGAYQMTDKVDFTLQAQGVTQGFFSLGLLSAGISYHF